MELEKRGVPVALIATEEFATLALSELEALGSGAVPIVLVPHPFGDRSAGEIRAVAGSVAPVLVEALTTSSAELSASAAQRSLPQPRSSIRSKPLFAAPAQRHATRRS